MGSNQASAQATATTAGGGEQKQEFAVSVAGAINGLLELTTPTTSFAWPLTLTRNDAVASALTVGIDVSNLIGPSGAVLKLGLPQPEMISLATRGVKATISLTGTVEREGEYKGELGLSYGGKRQAVPIVLKRTRPAIQVAIEDIAQHRAILDTKPVELRLTLQEMGGEEAKIYPPSLIRLDRKEGDARVAAAYGTVELYRKEQKITVTHPETIVIPANESVNLRVTVAGLDTPGIYSTTMRVSGPNQKPTDKTFELSLKRPLCWAVGLIVLGVSLSTAVRAFSSWGRDWLGLQENAVVLRDKLSDFARAEDHGLSQDERDVLRKLLERTEQATSAANSPVEAQARLQAVHRQAELLEEWVHLRRSVDAVSPPSVAKAAREKLEQVTQKMLRAEFNETTANEVRTEIDAAAGTLRTAIRDDLNKAIQDLLTGIAGLTAPAQASLDRHRLALENTQRNLSLENIDETGRILDAARLAFADLAINELRESVDPGKRPPPGLDDLAWQAVVARCDAVLALAAPGASAERRIELWREAFRLLHRELIDKLRIQVEHELQSGAGAAETQLKAAQKALDIATKQLDSGSLQVAAAAYREAARDYAQLTPSGRMSARAAAAGSVPAPAVADLGDVALQQPLRHALMLVLGARPTLNRIRWTRILLDLALAVVLAAAAVAAGLQILYLPDPDWGSLNDLLLAFFWGAGLHVVANAIVQNPTNLAQRLIGARS